MTKDAAGYNKAMEYALRLISKKRYTIAEIGKKIETFLKKIARKVEEQAGEDAENGRLETEQDAATSPLENREEIIDQVVARLIELKYLDDEQFAKDYINEKIRLRPRGKFLLIRELKSKGIPEQILDKAISETEIDELEMAIALLSKRLRLWQTLPPIKQKSKAYQFLASKGIDQDAIYRALKSYYNT